MAPITEIIIWASPVLFGLACWLALELYKGLKEDVKDTKLTAHRVEKKQVEHETKITALDSKLTGVCNSIEGVRQAVHTIDKRTANVDQLNGTIKTLSNRLDQSDQNYGKILMILDGMAKRIGITFKKSGS